MLVVIAIPLPGEVAVGVLEPEEELLALPLAFAAGLFAIGLPESTDPVGGDLAQPGPKRTVSPTLKRRQPAQKDNENVLCQVVRLIV